MSTHVSKVSKLLLLPGDGIGIEIMTEAEKLLQFLNANTELNLELSSALVGGAAYDQTGTPLPEETLSLAKQADAVLLGAVGGLKWESLDISVRPEKALLRLRSELELFANLRPAIVSPELASASSLKAELVSDLDILIIRELTGGIYFGHPRGVFEEGGEKVGINTYRYSESEIRRIAHVAFKTAMTRGRQLCSVDKANVLEVTELWRDVFNQVAEEYPEVTLTHMYVDNAAMQLVRQPKQFDVVVTGNMFGDILSDIAAMLTGSIGMLPSASLDINRKGMYEPVHGSAPDIAGQNKANPLAMLLSVSLMFKHSLQQPKYAELIEKAVAMTLTQGFRTADLSQQDWVGTAEMGDQVIGNLAKLLN